ncbi:T9SS type A sorting domain-containing protein [candidate division KSB1 bacterium]|nr:T9SS type A sorting domain-containing protein [candidate division KSB1 bacterium]RQW11052.1 MAG: T9SS C-terminal target domain-containing protein [candidate division KSB1 bacterium]
MSSRRIFTVILCSLVTIAFSADRDSSSPSLSLRQAISGADDQCYEATFKENKDTLVYILYDRIGINSADTVSRCIVLKDVPFGGYYKFNVVAKYSKPGVLWQENQQYRLGINGTTNLEIISDKSDSIGTDIDVTSKIDYPNEEYVYIRIDHEYQYLHKNDNIIRFHYAGPPDENGGRINHLDFYSIELVPPPHIEPEPEFTANYSNTLKWVAIRDGARTQDVFYFDTQNNIVKSLVANSFRESRALFDTAYVDDLQDGHKYGYFVKASLPNGQNVYSDTTFSIQDASSPGRVDNLFISSYWNKYVEITWHGVSDAVSGVAFYQIIRSEGNSAQTNIDTVDTVAVDAYSMAGPPIVYFYTDTLDSHAGQVYTYRIDAIDAVGNRSSGRESDIVIEVPTPVLHPHPDFEKKPYYKGADITLATPISELPLPESHSLCFQAVRDSVSFFDGAFGEGYYFFDSGWLAIQDTSDTVQYTFRLNEKAKNLNFVNGHKYYFRLQLKDIQGNFSAWSDTLEIVPDCFAPTDVSFLSVSAITSDDNTEGWMEVRWGGASDQPSGIKNYVLYREVAGTLDSMTVTETSYRDSFHSIAHNDSVVYYVLSVDHVGNRRTSTNDRVTGWCQAPPVITYLSCEDIDDKGEKFTTRPIEKVVVEVKHFNFKKDIAELILRVNDQEISVTEDSIRNEIEYLVGLPKEGKYYVSARVLFRNKARSLWSEPDSVTRVTKLADMNAPIRRKDRELAISNYPNPFNPTTSISFQLHEDAHVLVQVFNVQGRLIATLTDRREGHGNHSVLWAGVDHAGQAVASGLYYYRVTIKPENEPEMTKVQSMLLVK